MRKLIIDGNDVYEVDMDCVKRNKNIDKCEIPIVNSMNDISNNLSNKEKEAD